MSNLSLLSCVWYVLIEYLSLCLSSLEQHIRALTHAPIVPFWRLHRRLHHLWLTLWYKSCEDENTLFLYQFSLYLHALHSSFRLLQNTWFSIHPPPHLNTTHALEAPAVWVICHSNCEPLSWILNCDAVVYSVLADSLRSLRLQSLLTIFLFYLDPSSNLVVLFGQWSA